jgi:hypothetical protein
MRVQLHRAPGSNCRGVSSYSSAPRLPASFHGKKLPSRFYTLLLCPTSQGHSLCSLVNSPAIPADISTEADSTKLHDDNCPELPSCVRSSGELYSFKFNEVRLGTIISQLDTNVFNMRLLALQLTITTKSRGMNLPKVCALRIRLLFRRNFKKRSIIFDHPM